MSHVNFNRGSQDLRRELGDLRNTMRWHAKSRRDFTKSRNIVFARINPRSPKEAQMMMYQMSRTEIVLHVATAFCMISAGVVLFIA